MFSVRLHASVKGKTDTKVPVPRDEWEEVRGHYSQRMLSKVISDQIGR